MVSIPLSGIGRIENSVCASRDVMKVKALTCVGNPNDLGCVCVERCREGAEIECGIVAIVPCRKAAATTIIGTNAPMMRVANMVGKIDEQTYTRYILMQGRVIWYSPAPSN